MVDRLRIEPNNAPEIAVRLFNQQLWCWGQDIECASGNALVRHGFERTPNPTSTDAPSLYRREMSNGMHITLRGFGVLYASDRIGVFVRRYEFRPLLMPAEQTDPNLWSVDDLPRLRVPEPSELTCWWRLTLELIDWMRDYELWVISELGIEYRRQALASWENNRPTAATAEGMASTWRWVGLQFAEDPRRMLAECGKHRMACAETHPKTSRGNYA